MAGCGRGTPVAEAVRATSFDRCAGLTDQKGMRFRK